ncbi:MAG: ATP-binding protein, partial [Anaerolineae bacterium]|nr:ATP-binding protein [Anaerolineae bacterium]
RDEVDLAALVAEAADMVRDYVVAKGLELRVQVAAGLPTLWIDRLRIRQVILNLVSNAVRFTRQGYVEVGAFLADGEVIVYVRDTGQGIPPDKLETIFERFEQVDSTGRRPHGGLGLGLAISRQLVRLHGGRIWAESEPGKGSTFYFSLPCLDPGTVPELSRAPAQVARPGGSQATAVVLCPDPLVVRMLARHMDRMGVVGARTAAEAAALVRELHPAAVVAVGDAPGALDEAEALLSEVAPLDVPAVVCDYPTERQAGSALGVSDFLVKPVTQRELAAAVGRLCPAPRRMLVADDDPDMLRLLCRMAQQEWRDVEVLMAATGIEAVQLASQLPDVLLLDLFMPGL